MRSSRRYVTRLVTSRAGSPPVRDRAAVRFLLAGDDPQQRALSGAVDAHQRDAVLFLDGEADVVDDRSDILHLAQMLNTDQHDLTCPSAAALWGSGS